MPNQIYKLVLQVIFMRMVKWISLALFLIGICILLLPDNGKQIIVLNENHGPSAIDLLGLGLIMIAWLLICFIVIKSWKQIQTMIGKRTVTFLSAVYFISIFGIVYSLKNLNDNLLWITAGSAALINTIFIILSLMKRSIL
jgi:hypothetical protein